MKKKLNIALLVLGIFSTLFLLIQVLPGTQYIYSKKDIIIIVSGIAEVVLVLALPILSYFPNLRLVTIVLAIILMAILIYYWGVTWYAESIYYSVYALIFIGFNLYYKS
ncbi:hypothetical protein [Lactobacillus corticis]|uniref:Uncharacterized protein n=1 Tax=Lactobacillus corticis TaxID=2201249 RepID=A0A916VIN2_9LACO|nr:hypothetical protein [Lactobacillus corticis]GFZ27645.1 hypothetical protein LCB40_15250 [Lactobacillus corticis]